MRPPLGYRSDLEADYYVSEDEIRRLLDAHPPKNPATRELITSGHCRLTIDGGRYMAPCRPRAAGPSHTRTFTVEIASTTPKGTSCN